MATLVALAVLCVGAPVAGAATVPASVKHWSGVQQFGMYGNATLDDCSVAAIASLSQVWDVESGGSGNALPLAPILNAYAALGGNANRGVLPSQAFSAWESGIDGTKIAAVSSIASDETSVEQAISQLGGIYAVVNITPNDPQHPGVPTSSARAVAAWTLATRPSPSAAEAHVVAVVGYDANFVYLATWGAIQPVTWAWWNARVVQSWAILPESFVAQGHGPVSSVETLQHAYFTNADMARQLGPYGS